MLVEIIKEATLEQDSKNNPWKDSPFKDLLTLKIDYRGLVGERIISESFHSISCNIEEDITNVNSGDMYDMKVNGCTIEIKTAYRDSNNSWQHENIYKNANVDYIIFVDFDYQNIIVSVIPTTIIPFDKKDAIFGKKATLRKGKEDGYKFDFSRKTHQNLINNHLAKVFSSNVTSEELGEWIISMI